LFLYISKIHFTYNALES